MGGDVGSEAVQYAAIGGIHILGIYGLERL
jgi:hypothetical protein